MTNFLTIALTLIAASGCVAAGILGMAISSVSLCAIFFLLAPVAVIAGCKILLDINEL
jgi:hypothetical protein